MGLLHAFTLLKPPVLSYKNRIIGKGKSGSVLNRETLVLGLSAFLMFGIYSVLRGIIEQVAGHEQFGEVLPARLMSISFLTFFFLLLFSNCIGAVGILFASRDLNFLLTLPVSRAQIYTSRLTETLITCGWMFLLFAIPFLFAYGQAFSMPTSYYFNALLAVFPFMLIPASLGSILATCFVNIIPVYRLKEFLSVSAFLVVCVLMVVGSDLPTFTDMSREDIQTAFYDRAFFADPTPPWFPSYWMSAILLGNETNSSLSPNIYLILLWITSICCFLLGLFVFHLGFYRGWMLSHKTNKNFRLESSNWASKVGRVFIPFSSPFRGLCFKEWRMFVRDSTQSLHLFLLLMLTFVYLYNFRALRTISSYNPEIEDWWKAILCIANISLGACLVAAMAARFVFPSVSLEGTSYSLLRSAPLSIEQLLRNKFYIWFFPVLALTMVFLVSGAWAIKVPFETVLVCAGLAVSFAIGIVGLGIGVGATHVIFDWESPTQVAASFGSLIYMLLSLVLVFVVLIPAGFLIILTSVPEFQLMLGAFDYRVAMMCAGVLIFYINYAVCKKALSAGAQSLRKLES